MKASDRLVGFVMDRRRSEQLRVLAIKRNVTASRLIRDAVESAYGSDLDAIGIGFDVSAVSSTLTKRKVKAS
jgi:hypothetical protein